MSPEWFAAAGVIAIVWTAVVVTVCRAETRVYAELEDDRRLVDFDPSELCPLKCPRFGRNAARTKYAECDHGRRCVGGCRR